MKSLIRKNNIEGAPFKIGNIVQILNNPLDDATFEIKYYGQNGEIIFFEYDCGCGQTFPGDPMIGVKFQNGDIEEFWREELLLIG
jgi:hypothetical protein